LTIEETFKLAVKNHQENKTDIAQELYNQVLKIDPKHSAALNNLGVIYRYLGENQKAKDCCEKAITVKPNYADAHNNLGVIWRDLGENQKAISCYEKAIAINPNYADAHNNLGVIYSDLGEKQKAKNCYEKTIAIIPNFADAHNNLGSTFKDLGENQKAINCYEKAIEINPNYVDAHNNLGSAFKDLGENQKAKSCYEKAIAINPDHAAANYNLGVIWRDLGENQKAKSCYEKTIAINPNHAVAHNNLGIIFKELGENQKAISCYEKAIAINPDAFETMGNIANIYVSQLTDFKITISKSNEALKIYHKNYKFINQSIPLFKLKHDVQQANYLSSKNYKINGIDKFIKIGDQILRREENKEDKNNYNKKILLNNDEINSLLPYLKENHIYQIKNISGNCINSNKNWLDVEDEYLNSVNQIMYIDNFLSDEALIELREFCLVSKVWHKDYHNKYLGAFSNSGFISSIHLQIAIDLQQKLPKLFGPHKLGKFWGFKYDSTLGKGINIHADFAIHNLNFWITPDEFNNDKNSGGLKVYDIPAPDNWTFKDYNNNDNKINKFLKENNANCTNVPYKFNRAVLFNSAYFHETDKINFKDQYEARRINNTYLFGARYIK
jgi:tetratricopeptide (TPR) repeat protein